MQPRTEAAIGIGVLAALCVAAAVAGRSSGAATPAGGPPTTFDAGPDGAQGLLESVRALGISVRRFRERPLHLRALASAPRQLLVVLEPSSGISAPELAAFVAFSDSGDMLIAGSSADHLMRCFGYTVKRHFVDSLTVREIGAETLRVGAVLEPTHEPVYVDSSRVFDVALASCRVPAYIRTTTLLSAPAGPVMVELERKDHGHRILLAADAGLFTNRRLRYSAAGPFTLRLVAGRYNGVIFEEYHHGYGEAGSLAAATVAWSRRSPWGWAAWQLAIVGVLALLFGAVRFGPVTPVIRRRRRSPLEHVRALATALAAAHGHDEAIAALVRGLRRRLTPRGLRPSGDWRSWLQRLDRTDVTPPARAAIAELETLTRTGQPPASVLRAADAVEDIWENLRP